VAISSNSGKSFGNIIQISHANGRSEDPAMIAEGSNIYLVWNDNRGGNPLELYYVRSTDYGVTWGPETALSAQPSYCYCPTITAYGSNVIGMMLDNSVSNLDVFLSSDGGASFTTTNTYVSNITTAAYPLMAVDSLGVIHATFGGISNVLYIYYTTSSDNGKTWTYPVIVSTSPAPVVFTGPAFIAIDSSGIIHITFQQLNASGGHPAIYYTNNAAYSTGYPTGLSTGGGGNTNGASTGVKGSSTGGVNGGSTGGNTGGSTGGNTGGSTGGNTGGSTGGVNGGSTSGVNGGSTGGVSSNGGTSNGGMSSKAGTSKYGSNDSASLLCISLLLAILSVVFI